LLAKKLTLMQIHICHLNQLFLICLLFLFGNWVSLKN